MRKLRFSLVSLLLLSICGLAVFVFWAGQRPPAHYLSDLRSEIIDTAALASGVADTDANLLLIRPQLFAPDYQSPAHLRLKLAAALEQAKSAGLLGPQTLVALPEHIGTWLMGANEKVEFYQARNRQQVRDWLLLGNPWLATKALLLNLDADRLDEALLRMKAKQMAANYQQLFSGLAREYQITLLAGSILLPAPHLENGQLRSGSGVLRNLSLVFAKDGQILNSYTEAWPWHPDDGEPQQFNLNGKRWLVERDWRAGYPQSVLRLPDGRRSAPLFLRGKLNWPIGGASRAIELTPKQVPQASEAPGSHLLNLWLDPQ
ncbi:MAG: hydrolase [Pseudomonas sp.]